MLLLCNLAIAQEPAGRDVRDRLSLWRAAHGIRMPFAKGSHGAAADKSEAADAVHADEQDGDGTQDARVGSRLSLSVWRSQRESAQRAAEWDVDADTWRGKLLMSAQDAAEGVMHAVDAELCQPHGEHLALELESDEVLQALALPVFVLNLPTKPDRRAHMLCLLSSLGFTNIEFPRVVERDQLSAGQISPYLEDLIHRFAGCNREKPLSCLACCLSHLGAIELALAQQHDKFIVLEDDLILGGSVRSVRSRLAAAVAELPPAGDMLYLEACFEDCPNVRFAKGYQHIGKAHRPLCGGGILFTQKGAKSVLRHGKPAWASIDDMYSSLIDSGDLDAYIMTPPVFYQTFYFGSSLASAGEINPRHRAIAKETHRPFTALCSISTTFMIHTFAEAGPPSAYHRALLTPLPADVRWLYGTWYSFLYSTAGTGSASKGSYGGWPPPRAPLHAHKAGGTPNEGEGERVSGVNASVNVELERLLVMMSDSGVERPLKLPRTQRVLYFTRSADLSGSMVQVGAWPHGLLGHHAAALLLDETSECLRSISEKGCPILAIVEDQFEGQLDQIEILLSPEHILHKPLSPRLVCYLVASASAVDTQVLFKPESRVLSLTSRHDSGAPNVLHLQDAAPAQQREALFKRLVQLYSLPLQTFDYLVFVLGDLLHELAPRDIQQFERALVHGQPAAALVFAATYFRTCAQVDTDAILAGVRWDMWHEIAAVIASPPATAASTRQTDANAEPSQRILIDVRGMLVDTPQDIMTGNRRPMEALRVWMSQGDHGRGEESAQQIDVRGVHGSEEGLPESDLGGGGRRTQLTRVLKAIALGSDLRLTRAPARSHDTDACLSARDAALDEAQNGPKKAGQACQRADGCAADDGSSDVNRRKLVLLEEGAEPRSTDYAAVLQHAVLTLPA